MSLDDVGASMGKAPTQKLRATGDTAQQNVEVVGDAAGGLPDRLRLFRVSQCS
ncbi:hypothetical protein [Caballeronia sp. M23-90]